MEDDCEEIVEMSSLTMPTNSSNREKIALKYTIKNDSTKGTYEAELDFNTGTNYLNIYQSHSGDDKIELPYRFNAPKGQETKIYMWVQSGMEVGTTTLRLRLLENGEQVYAGDGTKDVKDEANVKTQGIKNLTVIDNSYPDIRAINLPDSKLIISTAANGIANIRIEAEINPNDETTKQKCLWKIEGANSNPNNGNFGVNPPITSVLTPDVQNRSFSIKSGYDGNNNGILDEIEVSRKIEVVLTEQKVLLNIKTSGQFTPSPQYDLLPRGLVIFALGGISNLGASVQRMTRDQAGDGYYNPVEIQGLVRNQADYGLRLVCKQTLIKGKFWSLLPFPNDPDPNKRWHLKSEEKPSHEDNPFEIYTDGNPADGNGWTYTADAPGLIFAPLDASALRGTMYAMRQLFSVHWEDSNGNRVSDAVQWVNKVTIIKTSTANDTWERTATGNVVAVGSAAESELEVTLADMLRMLTEHLKK
jgi:hypothetical protein